MFSLLKAGYFGNRCDVTNICFSEPCQNDGSCVITGPNSYNCSCTSLFAGDHCESGTYKNKKKEMK